MDDAELVELGLSEGAGESGEGEASGGDAGAGPSAAQLARLREVLVAAYPEAVPELIGGEDLEALLASVETARAAYARVREAATQSALAAIPRGGGTRAVDPAVYEGLSPEGKIAVGLAIVEGRKA